MNINEVIAALQEATDTSAVLDESIRVLVGAEKVPLGSAEGCVSTDDDYAAANYTGSIDAALSLVGDGTWSLTKWFNGGVDKPVYWFDHHGSPAAGQARHRVAPIAVCIGTLRMRKWQRII